MSRSLRRGALAAALALSLAPLAACAAGNNAQTLKVRPDSAATTVGAIQVQNAVVLTKVVGNGPAAVSARIFNNGDTDQTLESVKIDGIGNATLSAKDGGQTITVPAHGTVLLGGKNNPSATITSGTESLRAGDIQKADFVFSDTGDVSLPVNVRPADGYFEQYGSSSQAAPTGQPKPSGKPSPSASPVAGASGGPSGTPTATPSASNTAH